MGFDQYHEPANELPPEARTFARMIASLTEEAEAIGWYEQRLAVEPNAQARANMARRQRRRSTMLRDPEPLYPKAMEMPHLTMPVSERDHRQGPATATVTLVEYGDYECPYCAEAYPVVKEIQRQLGPTLRFVFRHFPVTQIHPHARHAAEAAEATAAQGTFWHMHEMLFEHQDALDDEHLLHYAAALRLDTERFKW